MTIPNRTTTITGVFAKDAISPVPANPVPGTSYRDTAMTQAQVENGWNYKNIVDSAQVNQALYEYSNITKQIETYGFLPWSSLTDYVQDSICLGSDGSLYQAVQASGPSSTYQDPVYDTTHTYWTEYPGNRYARNDLTNLTTVGKNIGNWSTNVSNCITQIPQDIKLELNAGTLTLKAGSKIYQPNGAGVFDVITTTSDISTTAAVNGRNMIRYENGVLFADWGVSTYSSGDDPTGVTGWFYDTTANYIGYYNNGTRTNQVAFPLGIVTVSGGAITSIDRVFNGFGYIGSSAFVLPNVKGLIPNGRNADGTAKNIEVATTQVSVRTWDYQSSVQPLCINNTGMLVNVALYFEYDFDPYPATNNWILWYNPKENILRYSSNDGQWHIINNMIYTGIITSSADSANNYRITRFEKNKSVFQALDANNKEVLCGSMIPAPARAVQISLPYTTKEDCYISFIQTGTSNSSQTGNGIQVNGVYGSGGPNGVWGQTYQTKLYGGLYVGKGLVVDKVPNSGNGTYTVYFIPLKGMGV